MFIPSVCLHPFCSRMYCTLALSINKVLTLESQKKFPVRPRTRKSCLIKIHFTDDDITPLLVACLTLFYTTELLILRKCTVVFIFVNFAFEDENIRIEFKLPAPYIRLKIEP